MAGDKAPRQQPSAEREASHRMVMDCSLNALLLSLIYGPRATDSRPCPIYGVRHALGSSRASPQSTQREAEMRTLDPRPVLMVLAHINLHALGFSAVAIAYADRCTASYLVDAISKNLYDPFSHHFASIVSPLFLETYGQVDPVTRTKMKGMLLTVSVRRYLCRGLLARRPAWQTQG
ncbi:hypothetical protein BV25DRAFT_1922765 [Artomyces pyxidatus]|uniref:Uncharacterized protein n=1 Tax=Artomyces pyxidatus TaxID=48021 RepID=A0ACB8SD36_9AGAM|nr:hypothetical protein BV25DRAFT_1922765 [Artomyces pyxidatus]